jgi:hypothetical protein
MLEQCAQWRTSKKTVVYDCEQDYP